MPASSGPFSWPSCGRSGGGSTQGPKTAVTPRARGQGVLEAQHDPRRSVGPDARTHPVPVVASAHAGGRGRDAGLRREARRGRRGLGTRGVVARLRLRAVPQPGAFVDRRSSRVGRDAAARARAPGADVPGDPRPRHVQRRAARRADGASAVCGGRAVRVPGRLRTGPAVEEFCRSRGVVGEEETQGQGLRARREPRRGATGRRRAGRSARRAHHLRDPGAPPRRGRTRPGRGGRARGVSAPLTAAARRSAPVARDELALAIDRAAGARPIGGNRLEHHPDSPRALAAMLAAIAAARRTIHFENYIIRDDTTGRRFAAALAERARAGVHVRVLYDALGSVGTARRYWRGLRQAGAEVRAFHPFASLRLFELLARDHRKLLTTDGTWAILGGLCIGDEWAGDPARERRPWRDTMVAVSGPAVAALDRTFARTWARAGAALPPDELVADPAPCGDSTVRVVEGVPQRARVYRTVQLLVASAAERLWITDAYLIAPAPLYASLLDAAKAGVDERWARVGSSNLNVSSLLTNYELDIAAECEGLTAELADQFRRDMRMSREIVLQARRSLLPPRLVDAPTTGAEVPPDTSHKRSGYELGAVAVVALRRVAGGLRRAIAATAALVAATVGVLLVVFPRTMGIVFATGAFALALTFVLYGFELRRTRDADDA